MAFFIWLAAMADSIRLAIRSRLEPLDYVHFAGQSTGGCVAPLTFVHSMMSRTLIMCASVHEVTRSLHVTLEAFKLDYISFRPLAVMFPPEIIAHLHSAEPTFLAFVHHGDPVNKSHIRLPLDVYSRPTPLPYLDFESPGLCNAGTVFLLYDISRWR